MGELRLNYDIMITTRYKGKLYGAKTMLTSVFLDCVKDKKVRVGCEVVDKIESIKKLIKKELGLEK